MNKSIFKKYYQLLSVRNIRIFLLMTLLTSTGFYFSISVLYMKSRGLDLFQIYLLESVISISIMFLEIPTGYLADRFSRKAFVVWGHLFFFLNMLIFYFARSFPFFALADICFGIAIAMVSGADRALLIGTLKEDGRNSDTKELFSLLKSCRTLALLISLPIGSWLASYNLAFPVLAHVLVLGLAFSLAFLLEEPEVEISGTNDEEGDFTIRGSFRWLSDRKYLIYIIVVNTFLFNIGLSMFSVNQILFKQWGIGVGYYGVIMALAQIVQIIVLLFIPALEEKMGFQWSILTLLILVMLTIQSLILPLNLVILLVLFILTVAFVNCFEPLIQDYLNRLIPDRQRATILSIISFYGSIIGICMKPIIGYLAKRSVNLLLEVFVIGLL